MNRMRVVVSILAVSCVVPLCAVARPQSRSSVPQGPGEFLTVDPAVVGSLPVYAVAGDFNNDGRMDVVTSNVGSQSVSVLLGNGDGTFQAHQDYPVGLPPNGIAEADFNRDGNLDVVVSSNNGNSVVVLSGNGNGSFASPQTITLPVGGCFRVATGDVNNDGNADIVVACNQGMTVLLGNGDGTFQSGIVDSDLGTAHVTLADVNKDGKLDLVCANGVSDLMDVALGNGDGTFQPHTRYSTGPGFPAPQWIAVGDVNGDGNPDAAVANASGTTTVLLGNGDGTFQPYSIVDQTPGVVPNYVSLLDFTGDGKLDIAAVNIGNNNVSIYAGNGDGTFQPAVNYAAAENSQAAAVGDFNGDKRPDLAVVAQSVDSKHNGGVVTLLGRGSTRFQASRTFFAGHGCGFDCFTPAVVSADVNHDGRIDLLATSQQDYDLLVYLGNGDGTFQPQAIYPTISEKPGGLVVADFDGDGIPDAITANLCNVSTCSAPGGGSIDFFHGNSDGTFQPAVETDVPGNPYGIVVGDFNGDGKLDLAMGDTGAAQVSVLLGNGDGTFSAPATFTTTASPLDIAEGDFNGDGKLDLAVTVPNNYELLLGNGDGTFQSPSSVTGALTVSQVTAADLNADGKLDLLFGGGSSLGVALGNGDGTFQSIQEFAAVSGLGAVETGDLNGDGILDVAAFDGGNDSVDVWLGTGDASLLRSVTAYPVAGGNYPLSFALADANGDGAADILTSFDSTGFAANSLQALLNTGGTSVSFTSSLNPSVYRQSVTFTASVVQTLQVLGRSNPTGDITVENNGHPIKTLPLSNGKVTITTSTLPAGKHHLTAFYSGDGNYNPHSSSVLLQSVSQASTGSTLTSSPNPSNFGEQVTFTLVVAPQYGGTPTGTAMFYVNGKELANVKLSNGMAVEQTSRLPQGTNDVYAVYSGDHNYTGSTSNTVMQVVN